MQFIIKKKQSMIGGEKTININGKPQRVRYAPGEESIFVKDQSDLAKRRHIPISSNIVITTDDLMTEYLEALSKDPKHSYIQKYNPQEIAEKYNEKAEVKAQAMSYIVSANTPDLTTVAYILGGRSSVYTPDGSKTKSPAEIKQALYPQAEVNPQAVVDAFEKSGDKKMEFFVSQAFIEGIIEYVPTASKVIYGENKQTFLTTKPNMGSEVEQVAKYFKTQEGKKDLADVKNYFTMKNSDNDFSDIDGIGKATATKFREIGLKTFDDVKALTQEEFAQKLKDGNIHIVGNPIENIYKAIIK